MCARSSQNCFHECLRNKKSAPTLCASPNHRRPFANQQKASRADQTTTAPRCHVGVDSAYVDRAKQKNYSLLDEIIAFVNVHLGNFGANTIHCVLSFKRCKCFAFGLILKFMPL